MYKNCHLFKLMIFSKELAKLNNQDKRSMPLLFKNQVSIFNVIGVIGYFQVKG